MTLTKTLPMNMKNIFIYLFFVKHFSLKFNEVILSVRTLKDWAKRYGILMFLKAYLLKYQTIHFLNFYVYSVGSSKG